MEGNFWLLWTGLTLGILTISATILGLHSLIGFVGVDLGAVLMMIVVMHPFRGGCWCDVETISGRRIV